MLTFAAPFVSPKASGGGLAARSMSETTASHSCSPCPSRGMGHTYWPCELLNAFILKMAASGHCVSTAMMLGHKPYAVEQLEVAQQVQDDDLRQLARQLQAYFDVPPHDCHLGQSAGGASAQSSTQTLFRPWSLAA